MPGLLGELVDSLYRGFQLRCPCCGYGPLFATRFRTYDRCSVCDERFEREPGQWFGAVYVNLCLTLVLTVGGFLSDADLHAALVHPAALDLDTARRHRAPAAPSILDRAVDQPRLHR